MAPLILAVFLLLPGSSLTLNTTGLLIVEGIGGEYSVELWSPPPEELHCKLPSLGKMHGHTVSSVLGNEAVVCYESICYQLTKAVGWSMLQKTLKKRQGHTASVIGQKILLAGGTHSGYSTEMMPVDGGKSEESFRLHPEREFHCAIQPTDSTIIFTGGRGTETLVTEHSGLGSGKEVATRELPNLKQGRYLHACGVYHRTLIVAGGRPASSWSHLSSVEVYDDYSPDTQGQWREVTSLPSARDGLQGSMLAGVFHVTGGRDDDYQTLQDILSWDPVTESWTLVGKMAKTRAGHAVTEVSVDSISGFCSKTP